MPMRFIATAWPGEYGPKVVMLLRSREQLAQARVERGRRLARHGVVDGDGAALLGHLARRVEPRDAREARAVEPLLRGERPADRTWSWGTLDACWLTPGGGEVEVAGEARAVSLEGLEIARDALAGRPEVEVVEIQVQQVDVPGRPWSGSAT